MRVILALFRYFPHGGMQRDAMATAALLQERGHEVRLVCHSLAEPGPATAASRAAKLSDPASPDWRVPIDVLSAIGRTNHGRAARFDRQLAEYRGRQQPDVVIGFDKLSGLDYYFAADPCFVERTRARPFAYRWTPRYRTFRSLEGAVFARTSTTRILLLANATATAYRDTWQTPADRFVLLGPGVARDRCRDDKAAARRAAGRRELKLGDHHHCLLMLAANPHLKGLDRALAALRELPEAERRRCRLVAVGAGHDVSMAALAQRAGLSEQLVQLPGRDDIPQLLQAADLLIHPARRDTTGTVLLEALVAGLPVVCSDACGYAEHVRAADVGEVLAQPADATAMAAAIRRQLRRPRDQVVHLATKYQHEHDLHSMHEQLVDHITAAR